MTAEAGMSIPEGFIILVDPDRSAENGDLVVAKMIETNEVVFKKLIIDVGRYLLKPLNRDYKTIEAPSDLQIVGVVLEARLKIK